MYDALDLRSSAAASPGLLRPRTGRRRIDLDRIASCTTARRARAILRELQDVGEALRSAARRAPSDDWTGLRSSVISRMRAEAHESWTARTARAFDDLHLVWIGLASTVATDRVRGRGALDAAFRIARAPGLAGRGHRGDGGPVRLRLESRAARRPDPRPSVPENGLVYADARKLRDEGDLVVPLSAIVTREGRVSGSSSSTRGRTGAR